jgi:flagellar hook-associated protein 1 FlgK
MSFSASLANGLAGLGAAKLRAEVLSFNIANAASEGFARREVSFQPVNPGGLRLEGVTRADAGRADAQLLTAEARSGGASIRSDAARAVGAAFGEADSADGLYAAFLRFEQALGNLRLTPESGADQLALFQASKDLTATFARLDDEAQGMRLDADAAIGRSVTEINGMLSELDRLNGEASKPGGPSLDTVAERQRKLVMAIGQELDISVSGEYGDRIELRTKGGLLLLGDEPSFLEFTPAGTSSFELTAAAGDFSGLSVGGKDISPGTVQGIGEGRLAGHFAVRDVIAQDFATRLDAAASDLVARTEAADTTGPGGLFALSVGTSSAAQRITVNPAIDPGAGGELFRLRDGVGAALPGPAAGEGVLGALKDGLTGLQLNPAATGTPNAYSFRGMLAAFSSQLGSQTLRLENIAERASEGRQGFADQVARLTAVDTDRELQDLMMVEQAFAANARVVAAVDDMLARLLEI